MLEGVLLSLGDHSVVEEDMEGVAVLHSVVPVLLVRLQVPKEAVVEAEERPIDRKILKEFTEVFNYL